MGNGGIAAGHCLGFSDINALLTNNQVSFSRLLLGTALRLLGNQQVNEWSV